MKKLSKITAVLIAAMMLLLSFNVSAAVIEETPSETLLEQNFAGLSAMPEGWTRRVQGTNITEAFNTLGVTNSAKGTLVIGNDNAFDASASKNYTANFSFSKISSGSMAMIIGGQDKWWSGLTGYYPAGMNKTSGNLVPAKTGYTIQIASYADCPDNITLYKNQTPIIQKALESELVSSNGATVTTPTALKNYEVSLNVSAEKIVLTVIGKATATYTGVFEYSDPEPIYSGYTGLFFASTTPAADGSTGTVKNMSIIKESSKKETEDFYFNKQFGASDNMNVVNELGFIEDNGTFEIDASTNGLYICEQGNKGTGIMLDKYTFDENYSIRTSVNFVANYVSFYINYKDDENYYKLDCGKVPTGEKDASNSIIYHYGYVLNKCVNGSISKVFSDNWESTTKYLFMNENKPIEIDVLNTEDGLTISAKGYKGNNEFSFAYTDTADDRITSGKVGLKPNGSSTTHLKSLKIYSSEPSLTADSDGVKLYVPYMPWSSDASKVLTAVYKNDATKEIVGNVDVKDLSAFANGAVNVAESTYNTEEYNIRTFIWDSLDTMKPLTTPVVLGE